MEKVISMKELKEKLQSSNMEDPMYSKEYIQLSWDELLIAINGLLNEHEKK